MNRTEVLCAQCGADLRNLEEMTGEPRCWYCSKNWSRQPGEPLIDDYPHEDPPNEQN